MKRPDPLAGSGRFFMGPVMFVEINQALEKIRNVGWISRSEWPTNAEISPSEVDLSESEGRLLRSVPADELDVAKLQSLAQAAGLDLAIEYFPVIDSTNRLLMRRMRVESADTTLMVCDYQCAGRGRRGRVHGRPALAVHVRPAGVAAAAGRPRSRSCKSFSKSCISRPISFQSCSGSGIEAVAAGVSLSYALTI